jgi:hypothetical protein
LDFKSNPTTRQPKKSETIIDADTAALQPPMPPLSALVSAYGVQVADRLFNAKAQCGKAAIKTLNYG